MGKMRLHVPKLNLKIIIADYQGVTIGTGSSLSLVHTLRFVQ